MQGFSGIYCYIIGVQVTGVHELYGHTSYNKYGSTDFPEPLLVALYFASTNQLKVSRANNIPQNLRKVSIFVSTTALCLSYAHKSHYFPAPTFFFSPVTVVMSETLTQNGTNDTTPTTSN